MIVSALYIFLAVVVLGFLIFIHELGHYWMARRVGMRVETFSIGFGPPIISWMRNGVRWQIGWLPFGGYVKIAGLDVDKNTDPYSVPDGFFGKSPLDRIKVAFMGPFVNILFAFLVFALIWMSGGREKTFAEFTHIIGWVDPHSELYKDGVRPGDEILAYNQRLFTNAADNIYAPTINGDEIEVSGFKVNYETGERTPFNYKVKTYAYPNPQLKNRGIKTAGILNPANYFIYEETEPGSSEKTPIASSGIQDKDRVVWVDGELIFSMEQLSHILNDSRAMLTLQRKDKTILRRVPRVELQELKLDPEQREEFVDWQHEAQLGSVKSQKLLSIPYILTNEAVVEGPLKLIDKDLHDQVFSPHPLSEVELPLEPGDKIIAVDGHPVSHSYELLALLQQHLVNIIVDRNPADAGKINWKKADEEFNKELDLKDLQRMASSIGTHSAIKHFGHLYLLNPVQPKTRLELAATPEQKALLTTAWLEQKKEIESMTDPERQAQALQLLNKQEKQLLLGLPFQDRKVIYNPLPMQQFEDICSQIWHTLQSLVSGILNVKALSGPVGIIKEVYATTQIGFKESLYFIGFMSLNLGIFNLLPVPMLDGGTIVITFLELITRRRIPPKTLEKIILPFAILLIGLFIYVTFNDISQLFSGFHDFIYRFWH